MCRYNIPFAREWTAWEQRKLSELGEIITGSTPSTQHSEYYSDNGIPWVTPTDISDNITYETTRKLSKEGEKVARVVPSNTILVTCIASIGKNTMLGTTGSFNQQINALVPNQEKYNPYFLFTESSLWSKEMQSIAAQGTMQIINKTEFSALITYTPTLDEQKQIGSYFHNLDNLITLHQRLGKLGVETFFHSAWEQRKLGDVFIEYSEKNHEELPPLTIIQGKGTILREESDRNLIYDKSGLKNYKLVNENDFILHLRSFEGGLEKANSRGIVSPAYHIFYGEETDTRFYYPFFRSHYFISVLLKPHIYGIRDGKSIDVEGMKSIKIPYPTIEEQNQIGDYYEALDHLITLHQRKLSSMTNRTSINQSFPSVLSALPLAS